METPYFLRCFYLYNMALFNFKKKINKKDLSQLLYSQAKQLSLGEYSDLRGKGGNFETAPLRESDEEIFIHERLVLIFWIVDLILQEKGRGIMAYIHETYFKDIGILDNNDESKKEMDFIINRYREYYDAYKDSDYLWLRGIINKNILREKSFHLNARDDYLTAMDFSTLVRVISDFLKKYNIVED